MSTFDLTTYPLRDSTRIEDDSPDKLDQLDDGDYRYRVLGSADVEKIRCVFNPMTETEKLAFEAYLRANRGTNFDILTEDSSPTITYRGYIVPRSVRGAKRDGFWTMSFDFRGKVV